MERPEPVVQDSAETEDAAGKISFRMLDKIETTATYSGASNS
ncbi:hypothetical protein AB0C14_15270 [Microbispora hainanensis]